MKTLEQSIQANRVRVARYKRAEYVLRQVRLRVFDYEDAGKADKADRVIKTCRRILAPLWEARSRNSENKRTQNYMM
jgi:hypothetical protein